MKYGVYCYSSSGEWHLLYGKLGADTIGDAQELCYRERRPNPMWSLGGYVSMVIDYAGQTITDDEKGMKIGKEALKNCKNCRYSNKCSKINNYL